MSVSDQERTAIQVQVRKSVNTDIEAISNLVRAAFVAVEGQEIVSLIDELSADASAEPRLSLVAITNGKVIGHIFFTNAKIEPPGRAGSAAFLAPLSVHPEA